MLGSDQVIRTYLRESYEFISQNFIEKVASEAVSESFATYTNHCVD